MMVIKTEPTEDPLGESLSKLEKIKHFDELRLKYVDMVEKFNAFKMKCESLESEVKAAETRSKLGKGNKVFRGLGGGEGKYEEIFEDKTVPEGWKSGWRTMEGFSAGTRTKSYFAPNGRYCGTRLAALHYMVTELGSSKEEVDLMRKGLMEEGWKEHDNLPPGWLHGEGKKAGREGKFTNKFATEDYSSMLSTKAAVRHLLLYSTEEVLEVFLAGFHLNRLGTVLMDWRSSIDLPFPWKIGRTRSSLSSLGVLIITPDGSMFTQWASCRELHEKAGETSKEVLDRVENFLTTGVPGIKLKGLKSSIQRPDAASPKSSSNSSVVERVWLEDALMPPGWKTCPGYIRTYKSPDGKFFQSIGGVLRYLAGEVGKEEELGLFRDYLGRDGWQTTTYLPEGWHLKQKRTERGFTFLSQLFEPFRSTKTMYDHLRQEGFGEEAVERFENNWRSLDMEPPAKKVKNDKSAMDVKLKTEKIASDAKPIKKKVLVKQEPDDSMDGYDSDRSETSEGSEASKDDEDDEDGGHIGLEWEEEDKWLPPGWRVAETPLATGRVLRRYQAPGGDHLGSLQEALKHLLQGGTPMEEVGVMAGGLECEGWTRLSSSSQPGWWLRGTTFLAPSMQAFPGLREAASYMEEQGYSRQEREAILGVTGQKRDDGLGATSRESSKSPPPVPNLKKEKNTGTEKNAGTKVKQEAMDSGRNNWVSEASLPPGWRVSYSGEGEASPQFLTPEGRKISSRAQAIKYLSTLPSTQEQVARMREGLAREGWLSEPHLPPGWLVKEAGEGRTVYLTPNYETLKSLKNAISYMRLKSYAQSVIDKFLTNRNPPDKRPAEDTPAPAQPAKEARVAVKKEAVVAIKQEKGVRAPAPPHEPCLPLPPGWKEGPEGGLVSPQGKTFPSRVSAVQWMIASQAPSEEIYMVWSSLGREGWALATETTTLLPGGWRLRWEEGVADWYYLSTQCSVLRSTQRARLELVASSEQAGGQDLDRFDTWAAEVARTSRPVSWAPDPCLPPGWSLSSSLGDREILKDDKGARFLDRKEGIDHLIREQSSPAHIFRLWNTLHKEGWEGDETALPTGWKMRFYPEEGRHHYLSPLMEVVRGTEALQQLVSRGKEYSEEERGRVRDWRRREEGAK